MPVLPDQRLVFVHVPKSAGSAIERALGVHPDALDEAGRGRHLSGDVDGRRLQHLTRSEIVAALWDRGEDPATYRFFAIVREALDRAVSEFYWRVRIGHRTARGHDLDSFWEAIHGRLRAADRDPLAVAGPGDVHFLPQVRFLSADAAAAPAADVTVFRLEHGLGPVAAWLAGHDVAIGTIPLENASARPADLRVTRGVREIVATMYGDDYVAFGYPSPAASPGASA